VTEDETFVDTAAGPFTLSGRIVPDFLPDLCQVLSRHTGMLAITKARVEGAIYFRNGMVLHAEIPDQSLTGRDAFLELAILRTGQFAFRPNVAPGQQTIAIKTDRLLLDSAMYGDSMAVLTRAYVGLHTGLGLKPRSPDARPLKFADPFTKEVYEALETPGTFQELIGIFAQQASRVEVADALRQLWDESLLIVVSQPCSKPLHAADAEDFAPPPPADKKAKHPDRKHAANNAAPRKKEMSVKKKVLWLRVAIVIFIAACALLLSQIDYARLQHQLETKSFSLQSLPFLFHNVMDQMLHGTTGSNPEIRATILYAKKPFYGSFTDISGVPLTPFDIRQFLQQGGAVEHVVDQVRLRGFTGFPDEYERQRLVELVPEASIQGILKAPGYWLTQEALDAFLEDQPELRWGMETLNGPAIGQEADDQQAELRSAIDQLQKARAEFIEQELATTILDLKLFLLLKELQTP